MHTNWHPVGCFFRLGENGQEFNVWRKVVFKPFPRYSNTARLNKRQTCNNNLFCHCSMPECWDEVVQCELCEEWLHMSCEGFKTAPRASGSALSADCQTGESKSAVTPVPIFDLRVGQIVKSSVSFGVPKMPACDKIRPTSISGSPQVT